MVEVSSRDEMFCLMQGKAKGSTYKIPNPLKYHNKPTKIDGIKFASKKEAKRYKELSLLEKSGEISGLILQPKFLFPMNFSYIADFRYVEKGKSVVEDVKGISTPVFRLKEKCFRYFYPDIELRIIK